MKARSLCEKCDRVLEARCRLASHAGCWKRPHVVLNFHVRSQAGRRSCRRDRSRSREATEGHPKHPCGLPRAILSGDDPKITIDELLETAKSVDALLITLNEKCRKDVIDRMPENVKCISTFSIARNATAEKIIELSLRRLLHCLDAALPFIEGDLHVINIAPVAVSFGIPVGDGVLGREIGDDEIARGSAAAHVHGVAIRQRAAGRRIAGKNDPASHEGTAKPRRSGNSAPPPPDRAAATRQAASHAIKSLDANLTDEALAAVVLDREGDASLFEAGTEFQLVCEHRGARAVGQMQFLQHGRHMPFDSVQGAGEIFGDFQIAFASRNEQQHFPLPGAQAIDVGVRVRCPRRLACRGAELLGQRFRNRVLKSTQGLSASGCQLLGGIAPALPAGIQAVISMCINIAPLPISPTGTPTATNQRCCRCRRDENTNEMSVRLRFSSAWTSAR